jgi:hypothetical protein
MAIGLLMIGAQLATAPLQVGATVVRVEDTARPAVAVERGAVRVTGTRNAVVTTAREGDRLIVTLTY